LTPDSLSGARPPTDQPLFSPRDRRLLPALLQPAPVGHSHRTGQAAMATDLCDPTIPVVKNMLLLDSEGKRIAVKYFTSEM
jgi:hypothetical protein